MTALQNKKQGQRKANCSITPKSQAKEQCFLNCAQFNFKGTLRLRNLTARNKSGVQAVPRPKNSDQAISIEKLAKLGVENQRRTNPACNFTDGIAPLFSLSQCSLPWFSLHSPKNIFRSCLNKEESYSKPNFMLSPFLT